MLPSQRATDKADDNVYSTTRRFPSAVLYRRRPNPPSAHPLLSIIQATPWPTGHHKSSLNPLRQTRRPKRPFPPFLRSRLTKPSSPVLQLLQLPFARLLSLPFRTRAVDGEVRPCENLLLQSVLTSAVSSALPRAEFQFLVTLHSGVHYLRAFSILRGKRRYVALV